MEYSFFDLYPYFFLVFFCFLIFYSNYEESWKSKACFIIVLLFTICRYNVGWDYESYVDTIKFWGDDWNAGRYSILSNFIFYLGYKLNFYPFVFIVYGTIQLVLLKFIIDRLAVDRALSWIFFLLIPVFFLQGLSTIRQAVANEFVFLALYFLNEKQYKNAVFGFATAVMFHSSAILGLLIVPLAIFKIPLIYNWILFFASFFIGDFLISILSSLSAESFEMSRFQYYVESYESHKTSLLNIYYYVINIFFLLFCNKLSWYDEKIYKYITIGNIGIVLFNIFSFEPITATRLASMYTSNWILLLPLVFKIFQNNDEEYIICYEPNKRLSLVMVFPFVVVFFFFLMTYINAYNNHQLLKVSFIPYEFWWNNL